MTHSRILIVDDEAAQRETLAGYLRKRGFQVLLAANGAEGVETVRREAVDIVLTDMRMPGKTGADLLAEVKALNPQVAVVMMTAFGSVEDAVGAMKAGAEDYIQKPIDLDVLDILLAKVEERRQILSENRALRQALKTRHEFRSVIGGSAKMEEVLNLAGRAAQSRASVLLRGESGTGKEVIARAVHWASPRAEGPFVAVNMAAVPESLVESEFFGHEKGAFTGADRRRVGRFEQANGGTLFIDEIGDMPVSSQVKLLRVLQERRFERVGGSDTVEVDVRIIAATSRDLEALIREGLFREDLLFRLNVVCIPIPPLRERREDIPFLIDHFLKKYSEDEGKAIHAVSREAMDLLMKHDYRGNVRELENLIQRGVVMARGDLLTSRDLPPSVGPLRSEAASGAPAQPTGTDLTSRVEALEREMIGQALSTAKGNQSQAARELGLTERNLRYKMKKYGMK